MCLLTGGADVFVYEAWVLLQLICLLEIPYCVCWEELVQGSRVAFGEWADRSHWGPLALTLKEWSSGVSAVGPAPCSCPCPRGTMLPGTQGSHHK